LIPNERVVVLDAGAVAMGSAGRNSGFAVGIPLSLAMGAKDSLGKVNQRQLALSRQCFVWLERIVHEERIECGWTRAGRHYAAASDGGLRALDGVMQQFDSIGLPAERLDAQAVRARLGTGYYRGAVFDPHCALLQPAAFVRGLADRLPASVTLHENSRVTEWSGRGDSHTLRTATGTVRARRVIWATHTDIDAFTPLGNRYVTLYTCAGVTPLLTDEELGSGDLREWGVLPALRAGSTVRRLADGRILLRSLWSYGRQLSAREVRQGLQPLLAARFPRAAAKGFEYVWGGPLSITRKGEPYLAEFRPGAFAFTGCNGSGIVKGSAYGRLLAEMACNQHSEELHAVLKESRAGWIPPEPIRRIAVNFALARNARNAAAEI
jgi:glycine/D-amino acid oxidase-like deaminating enzyme